MLDLHLHKTAVALRALLADLQRVPPAERRQHTNLVKLGHEGGDLLVRGAGHVNVRLRLTRGRDGTLGLGRLGRRDAAGEETLGLARALLRRRLGRRLDGLLLRRRTRTAREGSSSSGGER